MFREEVSMEDGLRIQVRHLREVPGLSMRQIADKLNLGRKKVWRVLRGEKMRKPAGSSILKPYERLIEKWYGEYPMLKATQVYERLKSYGYEGCYGTVKLGTQRLRQKRGECFHELEFLPGEESQVDWMEWKMASGAVYGFVYLLAYSRYAVVRFYPRQTLEFFLDGHLRAFREVKGVAHRHRYDNIKTVIIRREPELQFNPQLLDFARHYGFSIHVCTPGRANEKGRVERIIRDIKNFLRVSSLVDLADLNKKMDLWRRERNNRVHRTTGKVPSEAPAEEKLKPLPQIDYKPYRLVQAVVSKTGFVEFETNRYSVPSPYAGMAASLLALPDTLEILVQGKKVATHRRLFLRKEKSEHPSHREKLLDRTPHFKYQRILTLMRGMGAEVEQFLFEAEREGEDPLEAAYQLFRLLRGISKETLLSAVREANSLHVHKVFYIQSLLQPQTSPHPVCPQDQRLLEITYKGRELDDYDDLI
jgi:transposase